MLSPSEHSQTKEMVVDFRRKRSSHQPVSIQGEDIEVVDTYIYLGVLLIEKLVWSSNTNTLHRRGQSCTFFLWTLRSFDVCVEMLTMFYHTMVASALFCAAVCWGGCLTKTPSDWTSWLKKLAQCSAGDWTH